MLVHQVERSAGPDESVFVDSRGLYWCLRAVGSMEMRRRIVFARSDDSKDSLFTEAPSMGKEFVFVTAEDDWALTNMEMRGWRIREAVGERPAFRFEGKDVKVFFVVRLEIPDLD